MLIFHQKYKVLSKEQKSAAHIPATTTANDSNVVADLECVNILFLHWNDFPDNPTFSLFRA